MRPHLFKTLAAAAMAMGAQNARATVQLDWSGDVLTGAQGIVVDGQTYDVQFENGSCLAVFPDQCELSAPDLFTFTTKAEATDASEALLPWLPLAPQGSLNSTFSITSFALAPDTNSISSIGYIAGCITAPATFEDRCHVQTPYGTGQNAVFFAAVVQGIVGNRNATPFVIDPSQGIYDDQTSSQTWAVWTQETTAVPEPATLAILGAGAAGLGGARLKKQAARRRRKE
jgi:hypothetical protein